MESRQNRSDYNAAENANLNVTVIGADETTIESTRRPTVCCKVGQSAKLLLGTLIGVALGIAVSLANPEDSAVQWISFPGTLFLRALSCLVVPLIFCNMVTGVAEITQLGGTGKVGGRTVGLYMFTTILAVGSGSLFTAIFMPFYLVEDNSATVPDARGSIALECNGNGHLTVREDGTVACVDNGPAYKFGAETFGSHFVVNNGLEAKTITETIMEILYSLVPKNVTQIFLTPDILSVVVFAVCFGIVAGKMEFADGEPNRVLEFMDQLARLFNKWIGYIIDLAPYAITFMIAGALAGADDFVSLMQNIGLFVVTVTLGLLCHVLISLASLFFGIAHRNPYKYLSKLTPVYTFAFGSASSAATLPLSLDTVDRNTDIPQPLAKFVLSLGSTINMDGSGVYFVSAIVFLAVVSGNSDLLTPVAFFNIILMSTIGAVGASPIPNAGLVMILTIWTTCFPNVPQPVQISYLIAIDWFLDRLITVTNVCGDTMVAQMVCSMTGMDEVDNLEKNETVLTAQEEKVLEHHVNSKLRDLSVTKSNLKSKMSNSFKSTYHRDLDHLSTAACVTKPKSMPPMVNHSRSKSCDSEKKEDMV